MKKVMDITGQQFGRLTVVKRVTKKLSSGNVVWICQCTCGNLKEVDSYQLRHGKVKSCGCLRKELAKQKFYQNPVMVDHMGTVNGLKDDFGNPIQMITTSRRNKSGIIGVSFDENTQRWVARMMVQGKYVLNATFKEFEDAVDARKAAELKFLKKRCKKVELETTPHQVDK